MVMGDYPKVVRRDPGPGTVTGAGDILTDSNGNRWEVVDYATATMLRSGTGNTVATVYPDGTIR